MAIQRGLTMLANLVDQALYVPEALLVLGNQTHATRGGSLPLKFLEADEASLFAGESMVRLAEGAESVSA